ncbi:hypothetical protein [Paenibacillus guangzhouensis]|uniref:hypothetical protein n=1 Tax=Paenibacillus guangzhouensis TaxID=1473112 RepID=UPI001266DC92|nr:hypothetical protein [Paenibacillus guangzhouensis]
MKLRTNGSIHPYNQNRLLLNFYWTGTQVNPKAWQSFMTKAEEVTNITGHFYQSYIFDHAGKLIQDKKEANPLSVMGGNSSV